MLIMLKPVPLLKTEGHPYLGVILSNQSTDLPVYGKCEETRGPRVNPHPLVQGKKQQANSFQSFIQVHVSNGLDGL